MKININKLKFYMVYVGGNFVQAENVKKPKAQNGMAQFLVVRRHSQRRIGLYLS